MPNDPALLQWSLPFLSPNAFNHRREWTLIVLNQPFPLPLFKQLWQATSWHCFADGGANRAFDAVGSLRNDYIPDLIKGDLDSIKPSVREWYEGKGVDVIKDGDQDSTDLMKCIDAVRQREKSSFFQTTQLGIIILGGLGGRLDQTIHTMSQLHKLRQSRERTFVVTEDNVAWVLNSGEHLINLDLSLVGPSCGLLPVGVPSAILTTQGLVWNLHEQASSFDGVMSTSNVLKHSQVRIKTSAPIWWCVEHRERAEAALTWQERAPSLFSAALTWLPRHLTELLTKIWFTRRAPLIKAASKPIAWTHSTTSDVEQGLRGSSRRSSWSSEP
ncbi:hypothetical protein FRB95_009576 [Tulasnella sp. JGI-2019a]|nr:hypothetical protein FRB95_009576 [Tulasnella sp. JGI-2019a]